MSGEGHRFWVALTPWRRFPWRVTVAYANGERREMLFAHAGRVAADRRWLLRRGFVEEPYSAPVTVDGEA